MKEKNAKVWKEIYEDFYKKPLEYTTIKQEKVMKEPKIIYYKDELNE